MIPERLVEKKGDWAAMRAAFRWPDIARFNIADVACERWARAHPDKLALRYLQPDGAVRNYTYVALSHASSRLANALKAKGISRGDRVAVLLPQTPETLLTHLAAYKIGAIVVPLFTLFGEDGLRFRLSHSGARALVTDGANLPKVLNIRADLGDLATIFTIDAGHTGAVGFWETLEKASDRCEMADT
ncbi:MAG: AMP-binding protein, partial [Pseudomonadota bacterium]